MPAVKAPPACGWKAILARQLPLLGHRNWIVVADAAYPWQNAPGIETICTGANHLTVARHVVQSVDAAPHIRPILYTDAELTRLNEKDAPGIRAMTAGLIALTQGRDVQSLPHEEILGKLDAAGQSFRILILKTTLTLPYTTLFVQLDCGYWNQKAEHVLRKSIV